MSRLRHYWDRYRDERFAFGPLAVVIACVAVGLAVLWPQSTTVEAQANRASIRLTAPYRVTVGAAAVQLTASGNVHGVVIKCLCPGQTVYVGTTSGVTTATGYPLVDGETLTLEIRNANQVYAIASAAAQSVAVLPFSRY